MDNVDEKESLIGSIKNILFKYCPYVDDRRALEDKDNTFKKFDIHVYFGEKTSDVVFTFNGVGVEEYITVPRIIELEEIEELINFLKDDHGSIRFDKYDRIKHIAKYKFNINKEKDSVSGINCEMLELALHFRENPNLRKRYMFIIDNEYFGSNDILCKSEFTDSVFSNYLDLLGKDELLKLLSNLSQEELREIMRPNRRMIFESCKDDPKVKELFK